MIESSNRLQLHYFFRNEGHAIDAVVRNECEREILSLFGDVSRILGLGIEIETEPPENGGFIEIWNFIGRNPIQITLVVSIITIILSRFPAENQELTNLQIENLKLDIEIKRKQLEKLNLEFLQEEKDLDEQKVKDTAELVASNYITSWRKSNLFKKLQGYPRVESIEIQRFHFKSPIGSKRNIKRNEFSKFILKSDNLPELEITDGRIDVIAPAIKPGKFKWKGFYNGDIINFEMRHASFKSHVLRGDVHFSNTFSIVADMVQFRKIDHDGSIKIINTIVNNVRATIEKGLRTEFEA